MTLFYTFQRFKPVSAFNLPFDYPQNLKAIPTNTLRRARKQPYSVVWRYVYNTETKLANLTYTLKAASCPGNLYRTAKIKLQI